MSEVTFDIGFRDDLRLTVKWIERGGEPKELRLWIDTGPDRCNATELQICEIVKDEHGDDDKGQVLVRQHRRDGLIIGYTGDDYEMSHREQDAHTTAVYRHNPNSLETVTEALNGAIRNHAAHTVQPCTATLATLDRRVTTAEHDVQSIIEWEDSVICRLIAAEVRITALEAGQPGMNTIAEAHAWQVCVSGVARCKRCGLEVPYTNSLPKTICLCSLPVPADDLEQTNAGLKAMVQTQASDLMQALARAGAAETEKDHMLGVLTDVRERSDAQIEVLAKKRDASATARLQQGELIEILGMAVADLKKERDDLKAELQLRSAVGKEKHDWIVQLEASVEQLTAERDRLKAEKSPGLFSTFCTACGVTETGFPDVAAQTSALDDHLANCPANLQRTADAALGAMVRKMTRSQSLYRSTDGRFCARWDFFGGYGATPEDAFAALYSQSTPQEAQP
jgi:hypothetical protein